MKFQEIAEDWRKNKEMFVKTSTISVYWQLSTNHLFPAFGDRETISELDIQTFILDKIKSGLAAKTVKDIIIVLKMILKFGIKYKMWKEMPPFEDIRYPTSRESSQMEVLNIADYRKAVNYVKAHFTFKNFGILLVLSTGMRIGEICGLMWSDFDLHNGVVKIQRTIQRIYIIEGSERRTELIIDTPKTTNSIREIPLSPDLLRFLKSLDKIINKEFFVLTNEEKPTEPRTYREYYKNLMKHIGIPPVKFHGMRHSFATSMIAAKVDVKTVSVLMGHSNVGITYNLYVHPSGEQKKSAIGQLFKSLK
jgi:integrase